MTFSRRDTLLLLLLPSGIYLFYFVIPLLTSFRTSLNQFSSRTGMREAVDLVNYLDIAGDNSLLRMWLTTFRVSLEAALITVLVGALAAYLMWRVGGAVRAYLTLVVLAPLFVSGIVRSYGWIPVTGSKGLLSDVTRALGFGDVTIMYNEPAVILAFVHILLPYVVLMVIARLDSIKPAVLRAAASLGATPLQAITLVILPLVYPTLLSAFLVAFTIANAAYAIPAIVGGGRVWTASIAIFQEQGANLNWPLAAALSTVLIVITLACMFLAQQLDRGRKSGDRKSQLPQIDGVA